MIYYCFLYAAFVSPVFTYSQAVNADRSSEQGRASIVPVFKAGDGLKISLPLDTASFLNGVYPIDDNGNIFLPVVGELNVVSMYPGDFCSYLKKTFEQYIHYPEIQVTPLIRVTLLGGFSRPGMYYIEPERSVWDLLSMAGGTVHEKGIKKMLWERDRKVIQKDLIPVLQSGKSLRLIGFQSGDQIWTPTENRSFRETFVRELLPIATFLLSLYVGVMTIRND
jgi:protein involved in polysaccharide export with SLBB domain